MNNQPVQRSITPAIAVVPFALFAILLAIGPAACGGSEPEQEAHHPHHAAGGEGQGDHHGHDGHDGHDGHAGHHQHDHSSPAALRPLMRDLRERMGALRAALGTEDVAETQSQAHAIAIACDDQDVHDLDAERFGPRFAEIDEVLHGAAAELASAAETGDLTLARERYATVLDACNACHAQAPTASAVDLADLALP